MRCWCYCTRWIQNRALPHIKHVAQSCQKDDIVNSTVSTGIIITVISLGRGLAIFMMQRGAARYLKILLIP